MAKIELSDVNQTLINQGRHLQEISQDTGLFGKLVGYFAVGQGLDNLQRRSQKKVLEEVKDSTDKRTEMAQQEKEATEEMTKAVEKMSNRIEIMTSGFARFSISLIKVAESFGRFINLNLARERKNKRIVGGQQLDLLETQAEQRDLFGLDKEVTNINMAGVLNSLRAAGRIGDVETKTGEGIAVDGKISKDEIIAGLGLFSLRKPLTNLTLGIGKFALRLTGIDLAVKAGRKGFQLLTDKLGILTRNIPENLDGKDAKTGRKILSGVRTARTVTAVGAGDLAFLTDATDDFDVQRRYRTFQKYGTQDINKVRKRMSDIATADTSLDKKLNAPRFKNIGRFFKTLAKIGGPAFMALDLYEINRLNNAIEAKKLEVGGRNLTEAELLAAYKSVDPNFQSVKEIVGGDYRPEFTINSATAGYSEELKKLYEENELNARNMYGGYATTGGPPNMNMQTNNNSSITSFGNGNINTSDGDDISSAMQ